MKEVGETEIELMAGLVRIIAGEKIIPIRKLKWNRGSNGSEFLTLNEIFNQLNTPDVIYVWLELGLSGIIYLANNYSDGEWHIHGNTKGFA